MKSTKRPTPITHRRKSYWRLFWAVVFLLHAPITFKAFGKFLAPQEGQTAWSSIFLLTLSNAFFILEIAFAYSIRLLSDRRAILVFMLVVAFLHAGVIDRSVPTAVHDWNLSVTLLPWLLSSAALAIVLAVVLGASSHIISDAAERRRQTALRIYGAIFKPIFALSPQTSACRYAARRGPPR